MNIDSENIEMWVMMMVDGELTADEQQEVKAFLLKNPQYESLINAFEDVKITTDEVTIIYPEIDQLLKSEIAEEIAIHHSAANNSKPLFTWKAVSIAASICLIFGLMWMFKPESQPTKIAMHTATTTNRQESHPNPKVIPNHTPVNSIANTNGTVQKQVVVMNSVNNVPSHIVTKHLDEPVILPKKEQNEIKAIDVIATENPQIVALESNHIKAPNEDFIVMNDSKLVEEDSKPKYNIYFASLGRNNQPKEMIQELGEDMIHSITTVNKTFKEIKKTNIEFQFASKTIKIK